MRRSIVLQMMLSMVVVLSGIATVAQDDMAQTNKQTYLDVIAEYNAGNHDPFYNMVTDPFMMNQGDPTLSEMPQDDLVGYDSALTSAMPDIQQHADVVVAQGEWVATHVTYTGTFTEPFSFPPFGPDSFPANNEVITWTELDFLHYNADGLVDEVWGISDPSILFTQMGIFPPMDEGDEETPLEQPAGYQTLSADELAATYTTGMEERNSGLWSDFVNAVQSDFATTTEAYNTTPFISWRNGVPYSIDPTQPDELFGLISTAMPDTTISADVVVAEGDWVASLNTFSGTFSQDADMFGTTLSATGDTITWQMAFIDRYDADGKIAEEIAEADFSPLLVGLGLMPPMGE